MAAAASTARTKAIICHHCSKKILGAPKRCEGCSSGKFAPAYCDANCQLQDWKRGHRLSCARLEKVPHNFVWTCRPEDIVRSFGLPVRGEFPSYTLRRVFPAKRTPKTIAADSVAFLSALSQLELHGKVKAFSIGAWYRGIKAEPAEAPGHITIRHAKGKKEKLTLFIVTIGTMDMGRLVAGPDARGRYLGMSKTGPIRAKLDEWKMHIFLDFKALLASVEAKAPWCEVANAEPAPVEEAAEPTEATVKTTKKAALEEELPSDTAS